MIPPELDDLVARLKALDHDQLARLAEYLRRGQDPPAPSAVPDSRNPRPPELTAAAELGP